MTAHKRQQQSQRIEAMVGQMENDKPNKKVLIVDDHEDFLVATALLIETIGCTVLRASNGATGLSLYKKHGPQLVITDLFMSEVSGVELIKKILKAHPGQKIVALSGYPDVQRRLEYLGLAMDIGATRILQKPVEPKVLLDTVRRSLRKRSGP